MPGPLHDIPAGVKPAMYIPAGVHARAGYNRARRSLPRLSPRSPAMPTQKQITVFLENKPGRLAAVLSELARARINVIALTVMDRTEHGVLRLVTDDPAGTLTVIRRLNAPCA